ncbi:unnamed protein product [Linum trigynum]|uniref:Gnk2-homologous domain-containing protein n=1 Tax=Linum trigynum TaxID=586398 RepID=A0AAV2EA55_9ROSI
MKYCSRSTLAAATAVLAIVALSAVAECRKGPDISILRGANCTGKSKNNGYDKSVARLLELLVQDTRNVHKKENSNYRYTVDFPDSEVGSATGGATCDVALGKTECWGCLVAARKRLVEGCADPIKASVRLHDCSLWFDKICS